MSKLKREKRIKKFLEIRDRLESSEVDLPDRIEDVYWLVDGIEGGLVGQEKHDSEQGAQDEAVKIATVEVEWNHELMDDINKIACPEKRRLEFFDTILNLVDEVLFPTPYCEIDGIECCLRGAGIPEELLN